MLTEENLYSHEFAGLTKLRFPIFSSLLHWLFTVLFYVMHGVLLFHQCVEKHKILLVSQSVGTIWVFLSSYYSSIVSLKPMRLFRFRQTITPSRIISHTGNLSWYAFEFVEACSPIQIVWDGHTRHHLLHMLHCCSLCFYLSAFNSERLRFSRHTILLYILHSAKY